MISYDILQNLENNCFELLNATTGMISGSNEKSMGKSHQNIVRALRKIVIANEMMGKGIICISGLQGAGKSTLMKNFYGLSDEYFNIKTGVGEKIPVFICENGECKGPEMYAMTLEKQDAGTFTRKVICMDEFIKLLDPAYELIQYRIKENKVIFHIASTITELECPFCGSKTSKVHSIYQREIQDLPMQGKKVILLVDTRKMRCMNLDCSHKTFSEKHPFVTAKSKKTNRLIQNILYTSSQLSSLNASKLLKSENITVCKSSICDLLKKNAIHCG